MEPVVSRSVLLVEDNEQNRYLLTFLLEKRGYQVLAVEDGAKALQAVQTFTPTVILLDIHLPSLDGYAVARALRQNEALRGVPIVAVTSYAMPGDRDKALAAGCVGYIEKPIDPDTFVQELERALPRALLVDDQEENLSYLSTLLRAQGWQVELAHHGAEALSKARQSPPALVISDLLMPVMDGYTLLRQWKADPQLANIPFVVYTATYTDPEDEQLALNLGADAFLFKPIEPEDLLARVRALLGRSTVPPTPAPPDEAGRFREYSETLIRKLEKKRLQLEESHRQLQTSEERFRQLAESIDDIFWLSDLQAHVLYVSPAYELISGQSAERLCAGGWRSVMHPEDQPRLGGTGEETFRIVRPDGQVRWLRARTYPVRDGCGEVYRVAGVARDITDYRRLEEQLRLAQKMEAVGKLAGGVAHDFNNLLSVILTYTSLVLDELPPGAPVRDELEEVRRAGERAAALTRQLLVFSRQQPLLPQVMDLGQVLLGMEKMLRRMLGDSIRLELRSTATRKVHADVSQVEQIVMNLVLNARDAMPRGGRVTVDLSDGDDLPHVVLSVSDTGVGMDTSTRERLFEPFFTTKPEGTGLGLSTVQSIVQQSRGHIYVTSEPGQGTIFRIYLPSTDRPAEHPAAPASSPATLRGSETILLVEDDDQVREMNRAILQRQGYVVLDARQGEEALSVSERFAAEIHLLLTDVVMPRMSGRELAERLSSVRPTMRVLYLSGYAPDVIAYHGVSGAAVSGNGVAFLAKPFLPEVLLRKVRQVLG
jgi:two-component system cell cycle sensor histidine kinase/response regulator CckA